MFEDQDNMAVDLNRVRKLAGLPEGGSEPPHEVYEPEYHLDIADEGDLDLDPALDAEPMATDPVEGPMADFPALTLDEPAIEAPVMPTSSSHWSDTLKTLEAQMNDIAVGEFKEIIDDLKRLTNYAEDIRRSLVTEGRKTFRDYVAENEKKKSDLSGEERALEENDAGDMTIGNNRNEAIDAIHQRMGGKPEDRVKAQQAFQQMQSAGTIKPDGAGFKMPAMDDETFSGMIGGTGATGATTPKTQNNPSGSMAAIKPR